MNSQKNSSNHLFTPFFIQSNLTTHFEKKNNDSCYIPSETNSAQKFLSILCQRNLSPTSSVNGFMAQLLDAGRLNCCCEVFLMIISFRWNLLLGWWQLVHLESGETLPKLDFEQMLPTPRKELISLLKTEQIQTLKGIDCRLRIIILRHIIYYMKAKSSSQMERFFLTQCFSTAFTPTSAVCSRLNVKFFFAKLQQI